MPSEKEREYVGSPEVGNARCVFTALLIRACPPPATGTLTIHDLRLSKSGFFLTLVDRAIVIKRVVEVDEKNTSGDTPAFEGVARLFFFCKDWGSKFFV